MTVFIRPARLAARALFGFGLSAMLLTAAAQFTAPKRDPLNADAAVPPATHRSAIARYRATSEPQVGDWKEANRTVNRIGGWRAYAREAHAPASAASAPGAHKH